MYSKRVEEFICKSQVEQKFTRVQLGKHEVEAALDSAKGLQVVQLTLSEQLLQYCMQE
jgi:hypothetical protein